MRRVKLRSPSKLENEKRQGKNGAGYVRTLITN